MVAAFTFVMKETDIKLGARLSAVASSVRRGMTLYDIGSDHAYLPAYLLQNGTVPYAYVCDIAKGPLSKAESTVKTAGVADRVSLCLCDGLKGLDILPPCDIVIAGMGGELIADIIDASPDVKHDGVRLILQPMTKASELRQYLAENGFEFLSEITVTEGKSYTVISCRYIGEKTSLTEVELVLGKADIRREDADFYIGVKSKLATLKEICRGKNLGGADCSYEEKLIDEITKILNNGE